MAGVNTSSSASITLANGLSREYLLHHRCCPLDLAADGTVVVATAPDSIVEALDDIGVAYGRIAVPRETNGAEVDRLIERLTTRAERALAIDREQDPPSDDMADARILARQAPVVRYVNLLVRDAYEAHASDIHLEATRTGLSARYRLDGVLAPALAPAPELQHAIVSRIKLLAELDIAERRRPQDGRIRVRLDDIELDLRVSTVPTNFGESVVLRLLDRGGRTVTLDDLGMSAPMLESLDRLVARPHGMLLVTGPTGSGKTTTLYASLQRRPTSTEKIVTVEDPVEYQLADVTQVPVHRQAGVTFAAALRSILRQDPDVIMIGEMRDAETAEIGVQAAMTGHLVFSTLHTNDAISAMPRLLDLGIPSYLVSSTVEAVLAQRLVRRICDSCRTTYEADPARIAMLTGRPSGRVMLHRGMGCNMCRDTGFRGRLGIFELLELTDGVREAILSNGSRQAIRAAAEADGFVPMRADGWSKVQAGLTTIDEVLRVVET
jgi:general secretion pathway protein E